MLDLPMNIRWPLLLMIQREMQPVVVLVGVPVLAGISVMALLSQTFGAPTSFRIRKGPILASLSDTVRACISLMTPQAILKPSGA